MFNDKTASPPAPPIQPIVLTNQQISALPPEALPEPNRILGGTFSNIFASESTPTDSLSFGIARFPPKTATQTPHLALHRHDAAEVYYILQGHMYILLDGVEHRLKTGGAVYIPGGVEHGYCNPSVTEELVFLWGMPLDGFGEVEFWWSVGKMDWDGVEDW